MAIIGFNFNKINVEKKAPAKGKVNISNNISIKSVEEFPLSVGKTQQKGLKFNFEFVSKYEPKIAEIILNGTVLTLQDEAKFNEILSAWKKDKKLSKESIAPVINTALTKCNIKALVLSQEMNLPPPIPLPKVK